MRILFSLILLFILLFSCNQDERGNKSKSFSEIHLDFKDYDHTSHKSFIDLKIENGIDPILEQLKITDSGTVYYNFINDRKREIILNYENRELSLVISPGDKLKAELRISEFIDWQSKFNKSKITDGINRETNNLILTNTFFLDSLIQKAPSAFDNKKLSDINYKDIRISEMDRQLGEFESFISRNEIHDETFIDWGRAQIRYRAGYDLSIYPFLGKINTSIDDDSDYFNFINDVAPSDDELTYHSYLDFLEILSTSFQFIGQIADKYQGSREISKRDSTSNFHILFNIIKKLSKNKEREFLMAYTYKNYNQIPKQYIDSLGYFINDTILAQVNSTTNEDNSVLLTLLHEYNIPEDEKKELYNLYNDIEGKVIFHDFWSINCAPCVKEMPYYNDFISSLNNGGVEFVFYGVFMERNEWEKAIDKFGLTGRHHLLSKNQLAFFEKYFKVRGLPHHQLLKANGQIGEKINYEFRPRYFESIKRLIQEHKIDK